MTDQFALGYRAALEKAADVAWHACLVPPDGGNPTEDERLVCEEACRRILALPVPDLRETLDLGAGLDAMFSDMRKDDPAVPNWRVLNAAQQDTLRSVFRTGILAALGVTE